MGTKSGQEKTTVSRRKNAIKEHTNDWQGFVDVVLSDEDRERVKALAEQGEFDLWQYMKNWIEDGYKLSISPHNRGDTVIATLTGKSPDCVNLGFSMSAFGPGMEQALVALAYKHEIVCEGGVWANQSYTTRQQLTLWG